MSITTNQFLNDVLIFLGKIGNGKLKEDVIRILYFYYRKCPPDNVVEAKRYYEEHADEVELVLKLLADEESKEVYKKMITFRGSYDMRIHPKWSVDDIYFVKGIISLTKGECFVDCGAFDGDSIEKFINHAEDFHSIVAFEPDKENYKKLIQKDICDKVYVHNSGVWSENTILKFEEAGNEASRITDVNLPDLVEIKVEKIDSVQECKKATYIKMDIEGSEIQALEGAAETIKRNKPKLAISIYHKNEDMIKIPLMLHQINPEYKMYVRQHSHAFFDTVLYCVTDS